jgi:SMI1/KNR4 family protein SUKH-1
VILEFDNILVRILNGYPDKRALMDAILASVVNSWRLSGTCDLGPGATDSELREAEKMLRRKFPPTLIDLYRQCNGAYVLGGNIMIDPLDGKKLSVAQSSEFLRKAEWPIPDEAVVFGTDGSDDLFALWLPRDRVEKPIVMQVGSIFQPGSFSIVGTSLPRFLRSRTAYYLLLEECEGSALDELEVPRKFRGYAADKLAIYRWSDPELPNFPLSPYDAHLTADDVRKFASATG